jgi:hypothetical protein
VNENGAAWQAPSRLSGTNGNEWLNIPSQTFKKKRFCAVCLTDAYQNEMDAARVGVTFPAALVSPGALIENDG